MRRFHRAVPLALAFVASLVVFACPPAEEPGAGAVAEPNTTEQEPEEEKEDATTSRTRLFRTGEHPVILLVKKSADGAADRCTIEVRPEAGHVVCEDPAPGEFDSVKWTVVIPPGPDTGARRVCIAAKDGNPHPDVFAVPECIDVTVHDSFHDYPDCTKFPGDTPEPEVQWQYEVTVEDGAGNVLCMKDPEIYIKR